MHRTPRRPLLLLVALSSLGSLALAQQPALYWSDYDGDGRSDAFVVTPDLEGRLLRGLEGGAFADVTESAGLTGAEGARFAVWEDYDGDGRADLFVGTQEGTSRLYRALEGGLFEDVAEAAGLVHAGTDLHADFVDYDADGRPDLYVQMQTGGRLYHNEGDGYFALVPLDLPRSSVADASRRTPVGTTAPSRAQAEPSPPDAAADPASATEHHASAAVRPTGGSGGREPASLPGPGVMEAVAFPACARAIRDQDGGCLLASSTPTLGQLYPITSDLYVDATSGSVGLGTISPSARLDVAGDAAVDELRVDGTLTIDGDVELVEGTDLVMYDGLGYARVALGTTPGSGGALLALTTPAGDIATSIFDYGAGGGIQLNDAAGIPGVAMVAEGPGGGGRISALSDVNFYTTVDISGDGPNAGGQVSLRERFGQTTVDLNGDFLESGELVLYDRNGTSTNFASVSLRARDLFGTGGELLMSNLSGVNVLDVDAGTSGTPDFLLREHDGSNAIRFVGNSLYLYDSSGAITISYDRQSGTKSAVVETEAGRRRLFAMESPEVWFEDIGGGRLVAGRARIDMDPVFLETVTIDAEHPMHVFITPTARLDSWWVEPRDDHFVLHAADGSSDATFDWRVVAKRKGAEETRLPLLDAVEAEDGRATTGPSPRRAVDPDESHRAPDARAGGG